MTSPKHTDTSRSGDLVKILLLSPGLMTRDTVARVIDVEVCEASADLIETQAREIERLRLDVEAQEALQVSAYHAGLKAGWNFCVDDNHEGQQAAMASTDHIKELRRIREARAALGERAMTDIEKQAMTDEDHDLVEALLGSAHISNVAITDRAAARLQALAARVKVLEAENERLREALELADCALRGANMNMNVVERKVRAALGESHDQ